MDLKTLVNTNVKGSYLIPTPEEIQKLFPALDSSLKTVLHGRKVIQDILDGKDKRLFVVVGPCSIHDVKAAHEYAEKLKRLADRVKDTLFLVMRVYFEKPRTTVCWKGLINDPLMDDSFKIEEALKLARELLLELTHMGLPTATEALDPITPQYLSELISWSAIGARTTESQTHREMSSGLSTPVGFKNSTDGSIQVAIDAMRSALNPHHFLGIDSKGRISVFMTKGNNYSHIVLRGGQKGPNYDPKTIAECEALLEKAKLRKKIMVDCSHGNSNKDYNKQPEVFNAVIDQVIQGNQSICGMMLESHLSAGSQKIPSDLNQLQYGVSVTDACIDWKTTEDLIQKAHQRLVAK
ncbi:MAG: 3-deoxy-7-phosphoheptulonate synthase [Deltaproteobacteria bacterium]|nr:MAG: 3-deoxy-7-phosphoheptulonate synthase [Deltaproteobacteria bacterium]